MATETVSALWNRLGGICQKINELGGVVRVTVGPRTFYVVTDPDDSLTVATACMEKDPYYSFSKPWLGHGLITSRYAMWRNHRKLLNPAFSQILLDTFMGAFNSQSKKMVEILENEAGKGFFDQSIYTRHNALETICLTAMGVDFTDSNLNSKYVQALELLFKTFVDRFLKIWLHSNTIFAWSNLKKKQDAYLSIIQNMTNTVLQKRKAELNQNINADKKGIPENCTLSANMTCVIFLFGIHKHPVWGQDVNEFKPERWLAPDCPKAFAAFGLGKRNCIGKTYAMMSMKTTLAHVVRRFRIKADHTKMQVQLSVLLKPATGHHISIERRT